MPSENRNETVIGDIRRSVETWDLDLMKKSVRKALSDGIDPETVISQGLAKGMETISERFNDGDIFLPQVLAASKTIESAMEIIKPEMDLDGSIYRGTVIMGTVQGDIHEIGKNVCCAMLRSAGYKVIDLGPNVSPEMFTEAAEKYSADVIGGSALMTTTLMSQRYIVKAFKDADSPTLLIFGGAPCSPEWVDEIGGDGYSSSGSGIVALVNGLLDGRSGHR